MLVVLDSSFAFSLSLMPLIWSRELECFFLISWFSLFLFYLLSYYFIFDTNYWKCQLICHCINISNQGGFLWFQRPLFINCLKIHSKYFSFSHTQHGFRFYLFSYYYLYFLYYLLAIWMLSFTFLLSLLIFLLVYNHSFHLNLFFAMRLCWTFLLLMSIAYQSFTIGQRQLVLSLN